MSAICGIVSFGAPAAPGSLDAMLAVLRGYARGASRVAAQGEAQLACAEVATDRVAAQPLTFDGNTWLVADARIDARAELVAALAARGREPASGCADAALILHAWHAWGEDCMLHLLGDFAFAVWERREGRLFCARDPLGVKPFFYARTARSLAFASSLRGLRARREASARLDELAIADFLLFDMSRDPAATAFADCRRLPAAHRLWATREGVRVSRYWELDRTERVVHRPPGEQLERFRELLGAAVADRVRDAPRVAISMSGGLDSTSLAATVRRVAPSSAAKAFTVVYDRLIPDRERHYSQLAADALGIPIHHLAADGYRLYERFDAAPSPYPEPFHEPEGAASIDHLAAMAGHGGVALLGWDGDALLNESPRPYFRSLAASRSFLRLAAGAVGYAWSERRLWPRSWRPRSNAPVASTDPFPPWIEPALERRLGLRERWEAAAREEPPAHPIRPYAYRIFDLLGRMATFFERYDPGVTGLALECRHPLLDLRVVDFCLSLPPHPWCVRKRILRDAMRGELPAEILARPKTPLAGSPGMMLLRREDARWVDAFSPSTELERFVSRARIPEVCAIGTAAEAWMHLRPLTLDLWLRAERAPSTREPGAGHEARQGKAPASAEEAV